MSVAKSKASRQVEEDLVSVAPSMVSSNLSVEEADEWTAIQKFNALLHYQEQK
jgi:hypothetical protein